MAKKIILSIDKNGFVNGHIKGASGRKCMDYLELLEKIVEGEIISHEFTDEYFQTEQENNEIQTSEEIKNEF